MISRRLPPPTGRRPRRPTQAEALAVLRRPTPSPPPADVCHTPLHSAGRHPPPPSLGHRRRTPDSRCRPHLLPDAGRHQEARTSANTHHRPPLPVLAPTSTVSRPHRGRRRPPRRAAPSRGQHCSSKGISTPNFMNQTIPC
jgi:hypothetical protein